MASYQVDLLPRSSVQQTILFQSHCTFINLFLDLIINIKLVTMVLQQQTRLSLQITMWSGTRPQVPQIFLIIGTAKFKLTTLTINYWNSKLIRKYQVLVSEINIITIYFML